MTTTTPSPSKRDAARTVWLGLILTVFGAMIGFGSLATHAGFVSVLGFMIMFAGLAVWARSARTLNGH